MSEPWRHYSKGNKPATKGQILQICLSAWLCACWVTSVLSASVWPHGLWPARLLCLWESPGKNLWVGCHFLLQGIFLTQGSNLRLLGLLHWQADSLSLSHLGNLQRQKAEGWLPATGMGDGSENGSFCLLSIEFQFRKMKKFSEDGRWG